MYGAINYYVTAILFNVILSAIGIIYLHVLALLVFVYGFTTSVVASTHDNSKTKYLKDLRTARAISIVIVGGLFLLIA